jgi:hypothetical protein
LRCLMTRVGVEPTTCGLRERAGLALARASTARLRTLSHTLIALGASGSGPLLFAAAA